MKIISYGFVKEQFEKDNYILLSKAYKDSKTKLYYICPNGHKGSISWNMFQQGHRCFKCSHIIRSENQRLDYNFVKNIFNSFGYILLSKKYKNSSEKLEYVCPNGHFGKIKWDHFKEGHRCKMCFVENNKGKNNYNWRGGVSKNNLPLYDTYSYKINWIEEVRRDPENNDLLQVKCSENNCKKWFTPKRTEVRRRLTSLRTGIGENRFYCSDECKNKCSVFNQVLYPKTFIKDDITREVQQELRELVFQRDEHECQKCGNDTDLHCHHFEGVEQNPIESADIDNCITLCSECHKMAHEDEGCRYVDLKKDKLCLN